MQRLSLFAATLVLALFSPALGTTLDFTPTEVRTVEDGMPMRRLAFREGEKAIFFQPPKAWKVFGGGSEITFSPAAPLDGDVRLGNSTVAPSIRFDEQGLIVYRNAARQLLPKQAENVEILAEVPDAFALDDWQSFEMKFAYNFGGVKKVRSVLFVTMTPNRQVRLIIESSEKNFEEIYAAGRALLGSWFEPPAGWPGAAGPQAP